MACILKQDKLYPETETLYPETEYFVSVLGNKIPCFGYKVSISGYKLSCFGNKCVQALRPSKTSVFSLLFTIKACPHLFPKQDNLYPETGDFVAENGNKISCFQIQVWTGLNPPTDTRIYSYTAVNVNVTYTWLTVLDSGS